MSRGIKVRHYRKFGYRLVHVFIKPELYEELVKVSIERRANISDIINEALEEYLKHASRLAV